MCFVPLCRKVLTNRCLYLIHCIAYLMQPVCWQINWMVSDIFAMLLFSSYSVYTYSILYPSYVVIQLVVTPLGPLHFTPVRFVSFSDRSWLLYAYSLWNVVLLFTDISMFLWIWRCHFIPWKSSIDWLQWVFYTR